MTQQTLAIDVDQNAAEFSACGLYRYTLHRSLGPRYAGRPRLITIGMNPSRATAVVNDHTIAKESEFGRRLGFGGLRKLNLYGFIATDPADLRAAAEPVGPENDTFIEDALRRAANGMVLVAWGNIKHPTKVERVEFVRRTAARFGVELMCLGKCKDGSPRHPLMLAYSTPLEAWP